MNRVDNRKFKLTAMAIGLGCLFLLFGLIAGTASIFNIGDDKIRSELFINLANSLLNWWGLFTIGVLGFYHGANVSQKWLVNRGGDDNGFYRRGKTENTMESYSNRGYDSEDIFYAGKRGHATGSSPAGIYTAEGDIGPNDKSSGSGVTSRDLAAADIDPTVDSELHTEK